MSVDLEAARREWESGHRRYERAMRDEAQPERLQAQFDVVSRRSSAGGSAAPSRCASSVRAYEHAEAGRCRRSRSRPLPGLGANGVDGGRRGLPRVRARRGRLRAVSTTPVRRSPAARSPWPRRVIVALGDLVDLPARHRARRGAQRRPAAAGHRDLRAHARADDRSSRAEVYSSSDASSSPATITAIAATRLIQIPTPRPAKKKSSGIENTRTSTRTVASAPSAIVIRLSGNAAGRVDADLAQDDDEHRRDTEEEDDLARRSRSPSRSRRPSRPARARSTSP